MPVVPAPVTEITHTVTEYVARQLINVLLQRIGLHRIMKHEKMFIKMKYAAPGNRPSETSHNVTARVKDERIVADVQVQLHPNSIRWSDAVTFSHSPHGMYNDYFYKRRYPILYDKELGVFVYEQLAPVSLTMSCYIYLKEKSLIYSLPLMLYNMTSSAIIDYIDYDYSYRLPDSINYVLGVIYQHKRFTTKFPRYIDYLNYWSNGYIGISSSHMAEDREIVTVQKRFHQCIYQIESTEEEPTNEQFGQSTVGFTLNFNLYTQFPLVNTLFVNYPIIIENQLLPESTIYIHKNESISAVVGNYYDSSVNLGYKALAMPHNKEYIQIPFYDDWVLPAQASVRSTEHNPFLIAATLIDEEYPSTVVELGCTLADNFKLPQFVLDIIQEQEKIKKTGSFDNDNIIGIHLFYGDKEVDKSRLYLSPYNEFEFYDRMVNAPYRIVLTELGHIRYLNPIYYPILIKYINYWDLKIIQQLWYLKDRIDIYLDTSNGYHFIDFKVFLDRYKYPRVFPGNGVRIVDGTTGKITDVQPVPIIPGGISDGDRIISRIFRAEILCYSE